VVGAVVRAVAGVVARVMVGVVARVMVGVVARVARVPHMSDGIVGAVLGLRDAGQSEHGDEAERQKSLGGAVAHVGGVLAWGR
jgi:hypothetical protein